ncbi:unnamed protein product [Choristocarpus tenellus]
MTSGHHFSLTSNTALLKPSNGLSKAGYIDRVPRRRTRSQSLKLRDLGTNNFRNLGCNAQYDEVNFSDSTKECTKSLEKVVATALRDRCGVGNGDVVLALTSGGCDSVALLLALSYARHTFQPPLQVEACHFNHGLRGLDSDEDEAFVVALAFRLGIVCHVRHWSECAARAGPNSNGQEIVEGDVKGIQEKARNWRRLESQSIVHEITKNGSTEVNEVGWGRKGYIATAHHSDDQAETILLKVLRGAHLSNLQGMAWVSGPFVRPLLGVIKAELVTYLNAKGQAWREDKSNQKMKYKRNRVRLQLLPILNELAGGAAALQVRLNEVSRQSSLARDMLDAQARRWENKYLGGRSDGTLRKDEFPLLPFLRASVVGKGEDGGEAEEILPELVREELMHRFVSANTSGASFSYSRLVLLMKQIECGRRMWSMQLGGGLCVRRLGDILRVEPQSDCRVPQDASASQTRLNEEEGGGAERNEELVSEPLVSTEQQRVTDVPGWTVRVSRVVSSGGVEHGDTKEVQQSMRLYNVPHGTGIHIRKRRNGDVFQPAWRNRPIKVKDFLRGQGVPLHRRDEVALVCDGDQILGVYPSHPGAKYAVNSTDVDPVDLFVAGSNLFLLPQLRCVEEDEAS